jgi:hypothetical protein
LLITLFLFFRWHKIFNKTPFLEENKMVTKNYIVSAQKPTVVNAAVFGFFRNAQEQDLVIARINRIELLLVTSEGLKPHREIPIFGRIGVIKSFRIPGEVCFGVKGK